ncbi:hypothetical protein D3C75_1353870 [compost metagenome]
MVVTSLARLLVPILHHLVGEPGEPLLDGARFGLMPTQGFGAGELQPQIGTRQAAQRPFAH